MANPINLSTVNISIAEFQRISSGTHNAGEVKLAGAHKLDKMNNHVKHTEKNNERISHVEVVAIKQSLVKALSQNGVGQDEINRIRKDLGLAPKDAADKELLARSVVPLTRQQIRAILDRNAAAINAFNAQHHPGGAVLRASTQIYGPGGMDEASAARRDAVNAALADKNRTLDVNWEISRFEKVVSDYVDYNTPEERAKLLAVAEKQLDQLMQTCHCRPREDHAATATLELAGGQVISMPTGMSEKAFAERLENIIVRFKNDPAGPAEAEREVLKDYLALEGAQNKQAFLAELPNDPKFGLKARSLAVQCLYSRRVADHATLSLANRLGANDALSLATAVLHMPKDATPDQIRANAVLTALAARAPVAVPDNEKAYVPATSNTQYNEFVLMSLRTSPEKLLPAHRNLAEEVKMEVRLRLGEVAMPGETVVHAIVDDLRMAGIYFDGPAAWEARRNTVETIRESYMASALKYGALKIVSDELTRAIRAAGGNPNNAWMAARGMEKRNGDFIRTLAAAGTPEQAQLIVAEHRDEIERQARLYCKAAPLRLNLRENAIQALAAKLGAGPDTIRAIWNTQDTGIIRAISKAGSDLMDKILSGEVRAETDAEVEAAFASLVERRIAALAAALKQVDDLNPPLPLHVADNIKAKLCDLQKFDHVNVERIIREVANRADTAQLEELLRGNADKVAIQNELRRLSTAINSLTHGMLAGKEDIGPDDKDGIMTIAGVLLVFGRPGLADKLDAFFLRPDVKAEIDENNLDNPATVAMNYFREASFRQEIFAGGPFQASRIRSLFAEPREMAAFKAAGGEGRAVYAGYHAKDMPMLARCFALVKAARHDSDEEALRAVLDPTSLVRQLFGYGGRFIENPGNFRQGLALMTQYRLWFIDQVEARGQHRTDTPTLLNGRANVLSADCTRSMEKFVLEEIAHNPGMDLADENSENLFGMANN